MKDLTLSHPSVSSRVGAIHSRSLAQGPIKVPCDTTESIVNKEKFKREKNKTTTFPASQFSKQKRPFVRSPEEEMGAGERLKKAIQKETATESKN